MPKFYGQVKGFKYSNTQKEAKPKKQSAKLPVRYAPFENKKKKKLTGCCSSKYHSIVFENMETGDLIEFDNANAAIKVTGIKTETLYAAMRLRRRKIRKSPWQLVELNGERVF